MTARSHETIRVGLCRIIRDNNVSPKARMDAIELLMKVGGLLDEKGHVAPPKNKPAMHHMSNANDKGLQELLALAEQEKTG